MHIFFQSLHSLQFLYLMSSILKTFIFRKCRAKWVVQLLIVISYLLMQSQGSNGLENSMNVLFMLFLNLEELRVSFHTLFITVFFSFSFIYIHIYWLFWIWLINRSYTKISNENDGSSWTHSVSFEESLAEIQTFKD